MPECIGFINITVIVLEVLIAGVIRRVNVDYIYFAFVGVGKRGECVQVVALNEDMIGRIVSIADYCTIFYLGKNRQLGFELRFYRFGLVLLHQPVFGGGAQQFEETAPLVSGKSFNLPYALNKL